jgi:hypothetical protein
VSKSLLTCIYLRLFVRYYVSHCTVCIDVCTVVCALFHQNFVFCWCIVFVGSFRAVVELCPYQNDGRCMLGGGPFNRAAALMVSEEGERLVLLFSHFHYLFQKLLGLNISSCSMCVLHHESGTRLFGASTPL